MLPLEIPPQDTFIPFLGLDTSKNDLSIERGRSPDCLNVDIDIGGTVTKRRGHILIDPFPETDGPGAGVVVLRQEAFQALCLLVLSGGTLWIRQGEGEWEEDNSMPGEGGFLSAAQAYHEDGHESLYLTNGVNAVRRFAGGAATGDWPVGVESDDPLEQVRGYAPWWANTGDGDPDWPRHFALSSTGPVGVGDTSARLLAYGFSQDPNRVDFSELGVPWNFLPTDLREQTNILWEPADTDGGWFYVFRGDGDRIMWVGHFAGALVVMKRNRTFIYTGAVPYLQLAQVLNVGAVSHNGVAAAGNDLFFWSKEGPRRLSVVMDTGDIRSVGFEGRVTAKVRESWLGAVAPIVARHNPTRNRVEFFYAPYGKYNNERALIYNYEIDEWTYYEGNICEIADAVVYEDFAGGHRYVACRSDGRLTTMHDGFTDMGENIDSYYTTKWYFLPSLSDRARVVYLDVVVGHEGQGGSAIRCGVNYEESFRDLESVIGTHGDRFGGAWGSAWGADEDGVPDPDIEDPFTWGTGVQTIMRYAGVAYGHLYRFRIEANDATEFSYSGLFPVVTAKGKI